MRSEQCGASQGRSATARGGVAKIFSRRLFVTESSWARKMKLEFNENTGNADVYNIVVDDKIVGFLQLRSMPTKSEIMPESFESHIYYEINETERGKGYATEALKIILNEIRNKGLEGIILTVSKNNIASEKVILKNNGILIDEKIGKDDVVYKKFKIAVPKTF